jgi:DNA-binding PadR family transcriptional regulator
MPRPDRGTKPLTSSVFYVLLALADSERHGLGISADIADRTHGDVDMGPGTLYTTLGKMLDDGLIAEATGRRARGEDDTRRRYYRITRPGKSALKAEAQRLEVIVDAVRAKRVLEDPRPV